MRQHHLLRQGALALCLGSAFLSETQSVQAQVSPKAPWKPQLYFGTVNFNDQLTNRDAWKETAARTDGMLLHIHYFVRHMNTPANQKVEGVEDTTRRLAPALAGKPNIIELTYHIRDAATSPEEIARTHAQNIESIEKLGIPIAAVNVDWILGGLDVQAQETPRRTDETDDAYFTRIIQGVVDKSARYVKAFRAAGRDEKLIAVFPPVYVDEGPWTNVRQKQRPGVTTSRILNGLFDVGFDGFTADSPYFILSNPTYKAGGYYDALRSIQWTCHQRGKSFGVIINGDNSKSGGEYDTQFATESLDALNMVIGAELRPEQLVSESWYKGPFSLVPETQKGTYTNTVLQLRQRLNALQQQ